MGQNRGFATKLSPLMSDAKLPMPRPASLPLDQAQTDTDLWAALGNIIQLDSGNLGKLKHLKNIKLLIRGISRQIVDA